MMMAGAPEVIPPKPPRLATRQKALSAADLQQFIPKSMSKLNILFVASQDEPDEERESRRGKEEELLGQSLDSQRFQALKATMMSSSVQKLQGGEKVQKGWGGDTPKEVPQYPGGGTPSVQAAAIPVPHPVNTVPSDGPIGSSPLMVGVESQEVTSTALGTAPPLAPPPQVPRPMLWRASTVDVLNLEVSQLLSELSVCPQVLTASPTSSLSNNSAQSCSVEPIPAVPNLTTPTTMPTTTPTITPTITPTTTPTITSTITPTITPTITCLDSSNDSHNLLPAVVGSGDSPVVLRHKRGTTLPTNDHVTVPRTSLNYFRQSVKRKKGGAINQGGPTHEVHHTSSLPDEADQTSSSSGDFLWRPGNRRSWSQSSLFTGPLPGQSLLDEGSQLFELSGVHLSSESAALEGIVAEHGDVIDTLQGRQNVCTPPSLPPLVPPGPSLFCPCTLVCNILLPDAIRYDLISPDAT